jgi:hypothetical protein
MRRRRKEAPLRLRAGRAAEKAERGWLVNRVGRREDEHGLDLERTLISTASWSPCAASSRPMRSATSMPSVASTANPPFARLAAGRCGSASSARPSSSVRSSASSWQSGRCASPRSGRMTSSRNCSSASTSASELPDELDEAVLRRRRTCELKSACGGPT